MNEKRLCKDCPYLRYANVGLISSRYWCGASGGDGYFGSALGVRPWIAKPHPKCPLAKRRKREGGAQDE